MWTCLENKLLRKHVGRPEDGTVENVWFCKHVGVPGSGFVEKTLVV